MKFKFEFSKMRTYIPIIIMIMTFVYKLYVKNVKKQETFILTKGGDFISEGFNNKNKNEY